MTVPLWMMKMVITDLEKGDMLQYEVDSFMEIFQQQECLLQAQDTIISRKKAMLTNCEERVEYLDFLTDVQRNDYQRLHKKTKKHNTWYQIAIGGLLTVLLVKL